MSVAAYAVYSQWGKGWNLERTIDSSADIMKARKLAKELEAKGHKTKIVRNPKVTPDQVKTLTQIGGKVMESIEEGGKLQKATDWATLFRASLKKGTPQKPLTPAEKRKLKREADKIKADKAASSKKNKELAKQAAADPEIRKLFGFESEEPDVKVKADEATDVITATLIETMDRDYAGIRSQDRQLVEKKACERDDQSLDGSSVTGDDVEEAGLKKLARRGRVKTQTHKDYYGDIRTEPDDDKDPQAKYKSHSSMMRKGIRDMGYPVDRKDVPTAVAKGRMRHKGKPGKLPEAESVTEAIGVAKLSSGQTAITMGPAYTYGVTKVLKAKGIETTRGSGGALMTTASQDEVVRALSSTAFSVTSRRDNKVYLESGEKERDWYMDANELSHVRALEKLTGPFKAGPSSKQNLYFSDGDGKKWFFTKSELKSGDEKKIKRYFQESIDESEAWKYVPQRNSWSHKMGAWEVVVRDTGKSPDSETRFHWVAFYNGDERHDGYQRTLDQAKRRGIRAVKFRESVEEAMTPYERNQERLKIEFKGGRLKKLIKRDISAAARMIAFSPAYKDMIRNSRDMVKDGLEALDELGYLGNLSDDKYHELRNLVGKNIFGKKYFESRQKKESVEVIKVEGGFQIEDSPIFESYPQLLKTLHSAGYVFQEGAYAWPTGDWVHAPRQASQMLESMKESGSLVEGVDDPYIFKAVFMAGGGGSGKSWVAKNMLAGLGLKFVNSDDVLELLAKDAKLRTRLGLKTQAKGEIDIKKDLGSHDIQRIVRPAAKVLAKKKFDAYVGQKLGLVIDGTGAKVNELLQKKKALEDMGYDTAMVFVSVPMATALSRNAQRDRTVPEFHLKKAHASLKKNFSAYQSAFGQNFYQIDNDDVPGMWVVTKGPKYGKAVGHKPGGGRLPAGRGRKLKERSMTTGASPGVKAGSFHAMARNTLQVVTTKMRNLAMKFLKKPLRNPIGKEWIKAAKGLDEALQESKIKIVKKTKLPDGGQISTSYSSFGFDPKGQYHFETMWFDGSFDEKAQKRSDSKQEALSDHQMMVKKAMEAYRKTKPSTASYWAGSAGASIAKDKPKIVRAR
jgi:cytidylate kinase